MLLNRMGFWKIGAMLLAVVLCICMLIFAFHVEAVHNIPTDTNDERRDVYIALIIDDFGNNGDGIKEFLELDIPITAAVIPFLPYSEKDADAVHAAGKEVILHISMEPEKGKRSWLAPRSITTDLTNKEIQENVSDGFGQVKWAVGANNHMGSKVSKNKRVMAAVLSILKQNNMFYVDSATTSGSVSGEIAEELSIPTLCRDVFLDNVKTQACVEKQLAKLAEVAHKKGYAVGIGHIGPDGGLITVRAIEKMHPAMEAAGVHFVFISQLIKMNGNCAAE